MRNCRRYFLYFSPLNCTGGLGVQFHSKDFLIIFVLMDFVIIPCLYRIMFFVLMRIIGFVFYQLLAYKCPETLGNKGLSGTLCFDEIGAATLLQHEA